MEILVATHNLHKKEEIQQILGEKYHITSLTDYHIHDEIIEDGNSFHENALIKAKFCFEKTGKPSLGDDSGLVVPALSISNPCCCSYCGLAIKSVYRTFS